MVFFSLNIVQGVPKMSRSFKFWCQNKCQQLKPDSRTEIIRRKILGGIYWDTALFSPQFYSHLFRSLLELQLILWQLLLLQKTVFNSYPNIDWKWNCKGDNIQIFLSEIILAWENGSQGHHFWKFLISKFLKGLTHSALFVRLHTMSQIHTVGKITHCE